MSPADLPWGTITPLGALVAMVVYLVRAVVSGKWIPKASQDTNLTILNERLVEKTEEIRELRKANGALMEAVRVLTEQSNETLELGRAAGAVIQALPGALARGGEHGTTR